MEKGYYNHITDDLDALLNVLPADLREKIQQIGRRDELLEVILDLGRVPTARYTNGEVVLSEREVTREDIQNVVERVGEFDADNRAGIARTLHRIAAIRNRKGDIVGLTCRVGRAVYGTIAIIQDIIESGKSILLLGRPGVGKTTMLREAARVLAETKRVIIVDTSNEIGGDGDIPHPAVGRARRMQVEMPSLQHEVMIEAVENHNPEVIIIDEIGRELEALAARTIAERGVQLIATAHGNTLDNLLQNPTLCDLVGGIQAVTLSDEEARRRGTQKTVLERKAPPTFDVVIEIQEKDKLAVHHNVAEVVDRFLRGIPPRPEVRVRTTEGVEIQPAQVRVESFAPQGPFAAPAPDAGERPGRKVLRIYPYAVSRNRLERAIRELRVPAYVVDHLEEADLVVTVKSQEKRQPKRLRDAQLRGMPLHVVRSNTVTQLEAFLRSLFDVGDYLDDQEAALREVEDAIREVLEEAQPVELSPQNAYIRRLQHQLVQRYGLSSESKGEEPFRRVVIYPR